MCFCNDNACGFITQIFLLPWLYPGGGLITRLLKHKKSVEKLLRGKGACRACGRCVSSLKNMRAAHSVSNLGMFGISDFTAVINPPNRQFGNWRAEKKYFPGASGPEIKSDACDTEHDHRVISGAEAAKFVATFKSIIGQPFSLLFE